MEEERKEYLRQYKKNNLKRLTLDVQNSTYDRIKTAAELEELSVGRYIKKLIEADLEEKKEKLDNWERMKVIRDGKADFQQSPLTEVKVKRVFFQDPEWHGLRVAFIPEE